MTDTKIEIRNLYKVFGSNPEAAMKHVHAGFSKQDWLDQHGHVLGLRDINVTKTKNMTMLIEPILFTKTGMNMLHGRFRIAAKNLIKIPNFNFGISHCCVPCDKPANAGHISAKHGQR